MSIPANSAFDRTTGSHSLAAAGQRRRWADQWGMPCRWRLERFTFVPSNTANGPAGRCCETVV
jgi:hypothetical protein